VHSCSHTSPRSGRRARYADANTYKHARHEGLPAWCYRHTNERSLTTALASTELATSKAAAVTPVLQYDQHNSIASLSCKASQMRAERLSCARSLQQSSCRTHTLRLWTPASAQDREHRDIFSMAKEVLLSYRRHSKLTGRSTSQRRICTPIIMSAASMAGAQRRPACKRTLCTATIRAEPYYLPPRIPRSPPHKPFAPPMNPCHVSDRFEPRPTTTTLSHVLHRGAAVKSGAAHTRVRAARLRAEPCNCAVVPTRSAAQPPS
jgi:hypothetical protein